MKSLYHKKLIIIRHTLKKYIKVLRFPHQFDKHLRHTWQIRLSSLLEKTFNKTPQSVCGREVESHINKYKLINVNQSWSKIRAFLKLERISRYSAQQLSWLQGISRFSVREE